MELEWLGKFQYNETKVKELVSESSGNYMISVKRNNGKYRSIYVGQAENLQERLLEHLHDSETNDCLKNHVNDHDVYFRFCYVSGQSDRDDVERTLHKKYPCECNDVEPSGSVISITPPYTGN